MSKSIWLEKVYEVPTRVDEEGTWYRCLSDMHFVTSRAGWAVGSVQILRTQDGGKTWVNQYKDYVDQTYLSPNRVYAVSAKICWITAIISGTAISCCYTRDGGVTWKGKTFETKVFPKDIFFVDTKHGWIVGADGHLPTHSRTILRSEDGGQSWQAFKLDMTGNPEKIRFFNREKGWLLEDSFAPNKTRETFRLFVSSDGGRSWEINRVFDRWIRDVYILDKHKVFVTGDDGYIARTVDSGKNWKRLKTGSHDSIEAITFYNRRKGIAVGSTGAILLSNDQGNTWQELEKQNNTEYEGAGRVHFTSPTTGILGSSTSIFSFKLS